MDEKVNEVLEQGFWSTLEGAIDPEAHSLIDTLQRQEFDPLDIFQLQNAIARAAKFTRRMRDSHDIDDEAARPVLVDLREERVVNNVFEYDLTNLERSEGLHIGVEAVFPDDRELPGGPSSCLPCVGDSQSFYLFFPPEQ